MSTAIPKMTAKTDTGKIADAAKPSNTIIRIVIVMLSLLVLAGLWYAFWLRMQPNNTILHSYGRRDGLQYSQSVNGTRILSELYRKNGDRVSVVSRLTPAVRRKAQVIVWVHDGFEPPTEKQRKFLEQWLSDVPDAQLVYVGRDYDATPEYWRDAQNLATPEELPRIARQRAIADARWQGERAVVPASQYGYWFTVRNGKKRQSTASLSGPWAEGIQTAALNLPLESQLAIPIPADLTGVTDADPTTQYTSLLSEGSDQWIFAVEKPSWNEGRILVVSNGSFLLNYPLVNQERRLLAQRLVDATSMVDGQEVVLLQSRGTGPEVLDKDPVNEDSQMLIFLRVWPLNIIAAHLILLAIFYCLSRSLIFGRPGSLPAEPPADFSRHVTALGSMLERTKNVELAEQRIRQYEEQAKRASGKSHTKSEKPTPVLVSPAPPSNPSS